MVSMVKERNAVFRKAQVKQDKCFIRKMEQKAQTKQKWQKEQKTILTNCPERQKTIN